MKRFQKSVTEKITLNRGTKANDTTYLPGLQVSSKPLTEPKSPKEAYLSKNQPHCQESGQPG